MNLARCVLASTVVGALSRAPVGTYVWLHDHMRAASSDSNSYRIAAGDLIQTRVYKQDGTSALERVRQDGKIPLPFLQGVQVAALTPNARQMQSRVKNYVSWLAKLAVPPVPLERRMVAVVREEG